MFSRFAKVFFALAVALFLLTSLSLIQSPARAYVDPWTNNILGNPKAEHDSELDGIEHGHVIMPHLANATAKAALGRATWKLLHTVTLRFPEHPTSSERAALTSYFHLSARLYPCGECATEFQQLLKKYPPQTSSRRAAALWLCTVHNLVNLRLNKPEFDCAHLDAEYDCGCGDEPLSLDTTTSDTQVAGPELVRGGR